MKKFVRFFAAAVCTVIAAVACSKGVEEPSSNGTFTLNFSVDVVEPQVKATLTPNEGETAFEAAWVIGDQMDVKIDDTQYLAQWNGTGFSISELPEDLIGKSVEVRAIYPHEAQGSEVSSLSPNRTQTGNTYNSFFDTMEGSLESVEIAADMNLVIPMSRTRAIFYFHVTSDVDEALKSAVLNLGSNTITTNLSGVNSKDATIWFCLAPEAYQKMELVLTTETGRTATITRKSAVTPVAGKLYKVIKNVEFGEGTDEPAPFYLLNDISELNIGDEVIIAASASNYAIGQQNSNNRAAVSVVKSTIGSLSSINAPSADVEVLTIGAGSIANTYSFECSGGYLYAASSSKNYLKTKSTIDGDASWSITIDSSANATIKANGSYTHNTLMYNASSKLFSCYDKDQDEVCIYHRAGVPTPTLSVDQSLLEWNADDIQSKSVTVSAVNADKTEGDWTYSFVSGNESEWTVSKNADGLTISPLQTNDSSESDKTATITVSFGELESSIELKQKMSDPLPVAVSVATFINAEESSIVKYRLTGTISNITDTNYGNFDITDDTGTVYVRGLTAQEVTSNDKSFASIGLVEGDVVTLVGYRASYNGTPQVGGPAYHESHSSPKRINIESSDRSFTGVSEDGYILTIHYSVINGTDEEVVTATSNVSWINGFDYSKPGEVSFVVDENTGDKRDGKITLSCDNASDVVITVSQYGVNGAPSPITKVYTFGEHQDFKTWPASYDKHTLEYDECSVVFTSANKNTSTIKDMPVTKGQPVEVIMKDNRTISSITFTCKQWGSKAQTITMHYSTDGGTKYTKSSETSSTFKLETADLSSYGAVNAVKYTFSSTSDQVGIASVSITYIE